MRKIMEISVQIEKKDEFFFVFFHAEMNPKNGRNEIHHLVRTLGTLLASVLIVSLIFPVIYHIIDFST